MELKKESFFDHSLSFLFFYSWFSGKKAQLSHERALFSAFLSILACSLCSLKIIVADCECDSLNIYLQIKDRYQTITSSTVETKIQQVEKELKWWQRSLMWSGGFCILAMVFCIALIIKRKIKKSTWIIR